MFIQLFDQELFHFSKKKKKKNNLKILTILKYHTIFDHVLNHIYDVLNDLAPFAQFEKRDKYSWRSVTISKVAGFSVSFPNLITI